MATATRLPRTLSTLAGYSHPQHLGEVNPRGGRQLEAEPLAEDGVHIHPRQTHVTSSPFISA
jgi:hypothetical protein